MTEPINPSSEQDPKIAPEETHSPWVMLVTLLLLIGALLLSSAMLVHYAHLRRGGSKDSGPVLAGMAEKGSAFVAKLKHQPKEEPTATTPEAVVDTTAAIMKLFPSTNDGVKWPKLKLLGFGKGVAAEDGFAIINGKQIMVGGQLGDVKVIEIRTHGVVVELQGEQKTLTVEPPK